MRCIDNSFLELPDGWEARAENAKQAVEDGSCKINDRSNVWKELKTPLARRFYDKCWYCEIKQERSDNAVDHFRPKSSYPWLAFELTNFRYSCTFCNSLRKNTRTGKTKGKGDFFPLLPGTQRASKPGDEEKEIPMLLDPCSTRDPGFLDFYDDGAPCARYPNHEVRKIRAEISIKLYHLDHPALVDQRKMLAAKLKGLIKKADNLFDRCDIGDSAIDQAFDELIKSLRDSISEKAELSAFSRRVIAGYREKEWVEELLRTA
jgi:uncharacterized protein (TIGR02646 family)